MRIERIESGEFARTLNGISIIGGCTGSNWLKPAPEASRTFFRSYLAGGAGAAEGAACADSDCSSDFAGEQAVGEGERRGVTTWCRVQMRAAGREVYACAARMQPSKSASASAGLHRAAAIASEGSPSARIGVSQKARERKGQPCKTPYKLPD
eukprot:5608361-Pleurochrysis_carterae.AAC.4